MKNMVRTMMGLALLVSVLSTLTLTAYADPTPCPVGCDDPFQWRSKARRK